MLRIVTSLNRSGKKGSGGSAPVLAVPKRSQIAPQPLTEVPATSYEVYLFTCNDVGPMMLTPESYLSEEVRSTVYAVFCSQVEGNAKHKRVHFVAQVFGLSKEFKKTDDTRYFTIWGLVTAAPGQGSPVGLSTLQRPQYWNAPSLPADINALDFVMIPAYDKWDSMMDSSSNSLSEWSVASDGSTITFSIQSGTYAGTYSYKTSPMAFTGLDTGSAGMYAVKDDLQVGPFEFPTKEGDTYKRVSHLWSLVAAVKSGQTSNLIWLCMSKRTPSSD